MKKLFLQTLWHSNNYLTFKYNLQPCLFQMHTNVRKDVKTLKGVKSWREMKKRKWTKNPKKDDKGKAKESIESTSVSKFEWTYNTCGLDHNISFADYLLELLTERNGRLLMMYKRIKVDNRLLDVTGSGAIREIISRISRLGGEGVTENAVRSKITVSITLFFPLWVLVVEVEGRRLEAKEGPGAEGGLE